MKVDLDYVSNRISGLGYVKFDLSGCVCKNVNLYCDVTLVLYRKKLCHFVSLWKWIKACCCYCKVTDSVIPWYWNECVSIFTYHGICFQRYYCITIVHVCTKPIVCRTTIKITLCGHLLIPKFTFCYFVLQFGILLKVECLASISLGFVWVLTGRESWQCHPASDSSVFLSAY